MRFRTNTLLMVALAAMLLVALSACDVSIIFWDPPEPEPEPAPLFSFSLTWNDTVSDDPHLYLTYPAPLSGDTTDSETPGFTEPNLLPNPLVGDVGFYPVDIAAGVPDEATDTRGAVYYGNRQSDRQTSGEPAVEMTAVDSSREETALRGFPFVSNSTYVSTYGGGLTGLPTSATGYSWVGIMEVYAYATSGQLAYADGDGVDAVLTVYKYGEVFAEYVLPATTDLKGSSVIWINCFYEGNTEVYQLVPDIRVIQSATQIRSIAPGADLDASGTITVKNPAAL